MKSEKMLGISQKLGDIMARYQSAMTLGDIHERIRILAEAGLCKEHQSFIFIHNL